MIESLKDWFSKTETVIKLKDEQIKLIYGFSPEIVVNEINESKAKLSEISASIGNSDYLKALEPKIKEVDTYLSKAESIIKNYENIYLNIIKPIKTESKQGVRSTAIWAIISILLTTILSLYLTYSTSKRENLSTLNTSNVSTPNNPTTLDLESKINFLFYDRLGLNKDFVCTACDTLIVNRFAPIKLFTSGKSNIELEVYGLSEIELNKKHISTVGLRAYLDGKIVGGKLIHELFKVSPNLELNRFEGNQINIIEGDTL